MESRYLTTTVVVPAAGNGERFRDFTNVPKPLIYFYHNGSPGRMVEHAVSSCTKDNWPVRLGVQEKDLDAFTKALALSRPSWQLRALAPTKGQGHTVEQLVADLWGPVLVLNCDAAIHMSPLAWGSTGAQVEAAVFRSSLPLREPSPYSHINLGAQRHWDNGMRNWDAIIEKRAVSQWACAGAWYVQEAQELHAALVEARLSFEHDGGNYDELYLSAAFQEVTSSNSHIIAPANYTSWNTPADLEAYLQCR